MSGGRLCGVGLWPAISPFVARFLATLSYLKNVGMNADMAGQRPAPPKKLSDIGQHFNTRRLNGWLGGRDSNPDRQIQNLQSYRWTTSQ